MNIEACHLFVYWTTSILWFHIHLLVQLHSLVCSCIHWHLTYNTPLWVLVLKKSESDSNTLLNMRWYLSSLGLHALSFIFFSLHGYNISYKLSSDVVAIITTVIINHIICNKLVEILHVWMQQWMWCYPRSGYHKFYVYRCDSRDIFVEMIVWMDFKFYLYMYDSRNIFVETL